MPEVFALAAHPNPFAVQTRLAFELPAASAVRLSVFDGLGREVAVLVDDALGAGQHEAVLDGTQLPAGTYLVRLEAGGRLARQRITLVR